MNKKSLFLKRKKSEKRFKIFLISSLILLLIAGTLTMISLNSAMPYYVLKIIVPIINTASFANLVTSVKYLVDTNNCSKKLNEIERKEALKREYLEKKLKQKELEESKVKENSVDNQSKKYFSNDEELNEILNNYMRNLNNNPIDSSDSKNKIVFYDFKSGNPKKLS